MHCLKEKNWVINNAEIDACFEENKRLYKCCRQVERNYF